MWVPMAFEKRLRLAYARTFYGTGYFSKSGAANSMIIVLHASHELPQQLFGWQKNAGILIEWLGPCRFRDGDLCAA